MLARIHDVPVDLRTTNEADPEDDTFTMVSDRRPPTPPITTQTIAAMNAPRFKQSYRNDF